MRLSALAALGKMDAAALAKHTEAAAAAADGPRELLRFTARLMVPNVRLQLGISLLCWKGYKTAPSSKSRT